SAPVSGRAVEVAVAGQEQSGGGEAAIHATAKRIQGCDLPRRSHPKHRAIGVGAAAGGRAVERPAGVLDQLSQRKGTVALIKGRQGGQRAIGSKAEQGAIAAGAA